MPVGPSTSPPRRLDPLAGKHTRAPTTTLIFPVTSGPARSDWSTRLRARQVGPVGRVPIGSQRMTFGEVGGKGLDVGFYVFNFCDTPYFPVNN